MRGRFSRNVLALLRDSRMIRIRSGTGEEPHRFTGIWCVVVGERVFVRPWFDEAAGWHRAFLDEPRGAISVGEREIPVRGRPARGECLFDAIDAAYAEKYDTKASLKWVRGFATPRRRKTTLELLPR
jgi:hypothetical protein